MEFTDGDAGRADAQVVKLFSDDEQPTVQPGVPSALAEAVEEIVAARDLEAGRASVQAFVPVDGEWLVLVGAGDPDDLDLGGIRRVAAAAARAVKSRAVGTLGFHLGGPLGVDREARGIVEGVRYGVYDGDAYKAEPAEPSVETVILDGDGVPEPTIVAADRVGEAVNWVRGLVNEPAGSLPPRVLADEAVEMADEVGLAAKVLDEDDLEALGCGGILGVASGSPEPPRMVVLRHEGDPGSDEWLALVGKGVTFDSGGLSLKSSKGMETMKTDMGGAAAVLGAMRVVAQEDLDLNVMGVAPMAENLPSEEPIKPGDVLDIYDDQTVEVLNTDAEGRLLLADALSWTVDQGVGRIVDAATLTGSVKVALGDRIIGTFGDPDGWRQQVLDAGEAAGERAWALPTPDDYRSKLDSDIADIKNVGGKWGGAIIAALFLHNFVDDEVEWAHLDIAGAARMGDAKAWSAAGGTGAGVRTFVQLARAQAG